MSNETNHLDVVELNVGGVTYATTLGTLQQAEPESPLAIVSTMNVAEIRTIFGRDSKNRIFIDRDGVLFRYILDYLRNKKLSLPENFAERDRLKIEAEFYRLVNMSRALLQSRPNTGSNGKYSNENSFNATPATATALDPTASLIISKPGPRSNTGYIVVGYRGTFGKWHALAGWCWISFFPASLWSRWFGRCEISKDLSYSRLWPCSSLPRRFRRDAKRISRSRSWPNRPLHLALFPQAYFSWTSLRHARWSVFSHGKWRAIFLTLVSIFLVQRALLSDMNWLISLSIVLGWLCSKWV